MTINIRPASPGDGGAFTALACRNDGLGERLRAMTNAMYLAVKLRFAFAYQWSDGLAGREHQSADRQAEVFSPDFIARYAVAGNCRLEGFVETRGTMVTVERVAELQADPSFKGFNCHQAPLGAWLDPSLLPNDAFSYRDAFDLIGFSGPIGGAIASARQLTLPANLTALHLRGGDVIAGVFRRSARYQGKALPAPLASHLIRSIEDEGGRVLLFGQDARLVAQLKAESNSLEVADLQPDGFVLPAAQSLFEIVLMSRCQRIIAGSSGFALLARELGAVPCDAPRALFSPDEQLDITLRDLEGQPGRYSPLQVAFACSSAYMGLRRKLKPAMAEKLLQMGRDADPENEFFGLMLAATCFRHGEFIRGDRFLREVLAADRAAGHPVTGLEVARTFAESRGGSPYPAEHEYFHMAAEEGCRHAFLISCYLQYFRNRSLPDADIVRLGDLARADGAFCSAYEYLRKKRT